MTFWVASELSALAAGSSLVRASPFNCQFEHQAHGARPPEGAVEHLPDVGVNRAVGLREAQRSRHGGASGEVGSR